MYCGAAILVGFLYVSESCQRYSNLLDVRPDCVEWLSACLLVCSFHLRAALRRTELGDGAVEQVDLVVKVDNYPLVLAELPSTPTTLLTIYS
jgi:hypothetical protein